MMALPERELVVDNECIDVFKEFLTAGLAVLREKVLISVDVADKCEILLEKRFEQADLGIIMNAESAKQSIDLKERLRSRISTAK